MHSIRLRGPWQVELIDDATGRLPARRVDLPADWGNVLPPGFAGRAHLARHFHRPTNLDPRERVWLVVEAQGCDGVAVNGSPVSATQCGTVLDSDITPLVAPDNRLTLEISPPQFGAIAEVRLEIRQG